MMTLEQWRALSDEERAEQGRMVAAAVGGTFTVLMGEDKLAAITHESGIELVLIPGGTFERGVRADEHAMMRAIEWSEPEDALEWLDQIAETAPESVTVSAFLLARAPLLAEHIEGWVIGDEDSDQSAVRIDSDIAAAVLAEGPWRVPTSIEWEWVAREGGELPFVDATDPDEAAAACEDIYDSPYDPDLANGWGIWGLPWGDWVGDGKQPRAGRGGAAMLYPWQGDELILQLAGLPDDAAGQTQHCLRYALDVPTTAT
ncbi:MAG: hypothetical protein H0T46_24885 [Deltaproteobacteria bacterium]|nr:hypothetical protein [Deltaproteobacteria bacterium]